MANNYQNLQGKHQPVNNHPAPNKSSLVDDPEDVAESKAGHPPTKAEETKEDTKLKTH